MKVSGFTIIRNAVKFDYPVAEAIQSILPVCDEMLVSVGNSEDDTLNLIRQIHSPKIKIMESAWDDTLREGGKVLAVETNKAFDAVPPDTDWAFYIQGDEVIHEKYLDNIYTAMKKYKDDPKVEGLLFNFTHFFGSYDYVADSRRWYGREIRVIKNDKNIRSYRDAQGFRKSNHKKLSVKPVDAYVYHYGWVKHPKVQMEKREEFEKLWHSDEWVREHVGTSDVFDYSKIDSLELFRGQHPEVMEERISKRNWKFSYDPTRGVKQSLRVKFLSFLEKITGKEIGRFKNYKTI